MKKYKYRFSKFTKILIFAGIALAAAACALNTYYVIAEGIKSAEIAVYPILQYSLTYFVSVFLAVILISLLISSYYSVDEKFFKTSFGIIKSKYDISEIDCILIDRNNNKLSVYFKNQSFIVIVINDEWYEDFSDALLKVNPEIQFSINSKNPDTDKKA